MITSLPGPDLSPQEAMRHAMFKMAHDLGYTWARREYERGVPSPEFFSLKEACAFADLFNEAQGKTCCVAQPHDPWGPPSSTSYRIAFCYPTKEEAKAAASGSRHQFSPDAKVDALEWSNRTRQDPSIYWESEDP